MTDVDLGAVDACPLADRCESCTGMRDLAVETVTTPVGVYCLTFLNEAAADQLADRRCVTPGLSWWVQREARHRACVM